MFWLKFSVVGENCLLSFEFYIFVCFRGVKIFAVCVFKNLP